MRKIAHDTVGVRKHAVAAEDFWEFRPGDAVLADGFPGRVAEVLDGPVPGNESYMVTLDNGAGGGEYTAAQLSRPGGVTASLISVESPQDVLEPVEATSMMLASHWYPELGSILTDRLPNERLTFEAGLQHTSSLTPHLWSFQPGDRVLADGIPGYILTQVNPAISQAAGAGQLYRVVLANGLGEGEFFQAQLQHTAKKEWQLGEVAGEAICGGCEQYHPAWYHHEGQFGEGPIFETSCPKDGLSDFHTLEGLRTDRRAKD